MHWWKKVILPTLSLVLIIGCEARKERKRIAVEKNDSITVDNLFSDLKEWDEPTLNRIDSLGNQLSERFKFFSLDNEYDHNAFLVSTSQKKNLRVFLETLDHYDFDCRSFEEYQVCLKRLKSGVQIQCSLHPHPSLHWVLSIKATD